MNHGGPVITGWITAFFPYLKDDRTGEATVPIEGFFGEGRGPDGLETLISWTS